MQYPKDFNPTPFILLFMVLFYVFILGGLSINYHNDFGTSAFDLGVQDQGVWLISRLRFPFFNTVRGLNLFGDHVTFIHILIAPLYWFWNDVRAILLLQAAALATGAIPIYLIAREKLKSNLIPLAFAFSYLTYPALHYLNLENFHPDAFAVPLLLFAFYFAIKRRYYLYSIFAFLTLLTKEEISLTVFALGIYVAVFHNRKFGVLTSVIAILYFIFAIQVVLPYFNAFGYFRGLYGYSVFGKLGSTPEQIIGTAISKPDVLYDQLFSDMNKNYVFNLLAPVGFISILGLPVLFISLPVILMNTLSGYYYTHFINYHYTAAIIPFIFLSAIYGISMLNRQYLRIIAITIMLASSITANYYISPFDTSLKNMDRTINSIINHPEYGRVNTINRAISIIPENASVSASYTIVPHLTHRERIYMFPNPFRISYWGINGENPPKADVGYILLDMNLLIENSDKEMISLLQEGNYNKVFDDDNIILLKKRE